MASGDFNVVQVVGGKINEVKKVSVIEKIQSIDYPEYVVPDVDSIGTKGMRITVDAVVGDSTSQVIFTTDVYLSDIVVSCESYEDLDYWELNGDIKLCETVYTLESKYNAGTPGNSFGIYPKVLAGTPLIFTFHNGSGTAKRIWATIGYMFKKV